MRLTWTICCRDVVRKSRLCRDGIVCCGCCVPSSRAGACGPCRLVDGVDCALWTACGRCWCVVRSNRTDPVQQQHKQSNVLTTPDCNFVSLTSDRAVGLLCFDATDSPRDVRFRAGLSSALWPEDDECESYTLAVVGNGNGMVVGVFTYCHCVGWWVGGVHLVVGSFLCVSGGHHTAALLQPPQSYVRAHACVTLCECDGRDFIASKRARIVGSNPTDSHSQNANDNSTSDRCIRLPCACVLCRSELCVCIVVFDLK